MNNSRSIEAYTTLKTVVEAYPDVFASEYTLSEVNAKLEMLRISQRFGIPLHLKGYKCYGVERSYDDWTSVSCFEGNRSIAWSDDGRQPEGGEWLFTIRFTSGAYIFGEDYLSRTFCDFFEELKSFGAKYSDTVNNVLYFTEENSKQVYEAFWPTFKKYKALVSEELKQKRKKELETELAKLNGE